MIWFDYFLMAVIIVLATYAVASMIREGRRSP